MDKVYEAYLLEVKPGRAWSGKISRIDKLLSWMYDKGILNKGDRDEKDKLFRQYYRYYNDGDFPRSIIRKGTEKRNPKDQIEASLEDILDEFIKRVLQKYSGKYDRGEFHYDNFMSEMKHLLKILDGDDISSMEYFGKEYKVPDMEFSNLYKQLIDLRDKMNKIMDPVIDQNWPEKNLVSPQGKIYSYKKEALKDKGLWDREMIKTDAEIQKTKVSMKAIISNIIIAADTARSLKLIG